MVLYLFESEASGFDGDRSKFTGQGFIFPCRVLVKAFQNEPAADHGIDDFADCVSSVQAFGKLPADIFRIEPCMGHLALKDVR